MGCDIHAFVEYSENGDKYWHQFAQLELGRYYPLFSLMAGVRYTFGFDQIFPLKNMPDDLSIWIKREKRIWDGDAHDATWFTDDELKEILRQFAEKTERPLIAELTALQAVMASFRQSGFNVRLVVWFDN